MRPIKLANRVRRQGCMLVAVFVAATGVSSGASAQTLNTLVTFGGSNGAIPEDRGRLIADAHGNLFGTTGLGGASSACTGGCGTVFEIKVDSTTATGYASTPTTLVSFNGTDGAYPFAGLITDASGNLFGTTCGKTGSCVTGGGGNNFGTVFEIKVDGTTATGYASTPTTLVNFSFTDGSAPYAGLIADASGNLFGTTVVGGANLYYGTVFEIKVDSTTATGYAITPTTLVSFNGTDGAYPFAGLIADAIGNLFGTTSGLFSTGFGTVFEIKTDSTTATGYASTPTTLVSFNGTDGAYPIEVLIADARGNLFGTTEAGGATGDGTVFEVTGSGFVPPVGFAGTPGTPNCVGVTDSALAHTYGGIAHAATSLGYESVLALQNAVKAYCGK